MGGVLAEVKDLGIGGQGSIVLVGWGGVRGRQECGGQGVAVCMVARVPLQVPVSCGVAGAADVRCGGRCCESCAPSGRRGLGATLGVCTEQVVQITLPVLWHACESSML